MSTREIHLSCSCNYMEPDVSFNRTNGDHIIRLVDQEKETREKEKNEKIWTMDLLRLLASSNLKRSKLKN